MKGETKNIKAFELAYQGNEYQYRMTPHDNAYAIQLIEEAISIDPHYAMAHYFLATSHLLDFFWNWGKSPLESLMYCEQSAQKALELNGALGVPYMILGLTFLLKKQWKEAIESCEKAVSMIPNGADAHAFFSKIVPFKNKSEIQKYAEALRKAGLPDYMIPISFKLKLVSRCYKNAVSN